MEREGTREEWRERLGGWIRRAGEKRMGLRGIMGVKWTGQSDRLDVGSHKRTVSGDWEMTTWQTGDCEFSFGLYNIISNALFSFLGICTRREKHVYQRATSELGFTKPRLSSTSSRRGWFYLLVHFSLLGASEPAVMPGHRVGAQ